MHDRLQCFQTRPINYNLSRRQAALAETDSKIGEFICHMANFDTRVLLLEIYHTHTFTHTHTITHAHIHNFSNTLQVFLWFGNLNLLNQTHDQNRKNYVILRLLIHN